jgi:hypothetical protein
MPPLTAELAVSFYLQNGKLMFAVYHVIPDPKSGSTKFNRYQVPSLPNMIFLILQIHISKIFSQICVKNAIHL